MVIRSFLEVHARHWETPANLTGPGTLPLGGFPCMKSLTLSVARGTEKNVQATVM